MPEKVRQSLTALIPLFSYLMTRLAGNFLSCKTGET